MKICEVGGKGILLPLFGEAEQVRRKLTNFPTGGGMVGWRWLEPGDSLGNNGKLQERSPNGWRLEMWWFRRRFRDGRIDLWMFFMGCLVLWSLFFRTRKDQKKFVEVCYEPKKGGDPGTSKLNLDYLALLMAENLYRNMYSLY